MEQKRYTPKAAPAQATNNSALIECRPYFSNKAALQQQARASDFKPQPKTLRHANRTLIDETQPSMRIERTSFLENFHSKSDVNVGSAKINRYINPNDSPSKKVLRLLKSRTATKNSDPANMLLDNNSAELEKEVADQSGRYINQSVPA